MKIDMVKIASLAAGVLGVISTLMSGWVNDKKMDEKIDQRVKEALADREEYDDDEEEES